MKNKKNKVFDVLKGFFHGLGFASSMFLVREFRKSLTSGEYVQSILFFVASIYVLDTVIDIFRDNFLGEKGDFDGL